MRLNLAANPVLEWCDDLAARRVILWICGKAQKNIERKPHRIAFYLDVAFLHDVEQTDLNLSGEIGKLVQREDSPIRAGQHSVMDRQLVGEDVTAACCLDGIDVTDDVGHRDVRRSQLFYESAVALEPGNRCSLATFIEDIACVLGDRGEWIVVDFTSGNDGNDVVEKRRERPENS